MRLYLPLACFFVLVALTRAKAQEHIPRYSITLAPAILDPGTVLALQPGVQFYLNRHFSVLTEAAIPVVSDPGPAVMKGFRIHSELKYQFRQTMESNPYFSFQLAYTHRTWKEVSDYFIPFYSDYTIRFDRAEVSSPVYGA